MTRPKTGFSGFGPIISYIGNKKMKKTAQTKKPLSPGVFIMSPIDMG
jgi:hypothetical protein